MSASFSIYPAQFAKLRPMSVTATGTGTSWSGGTAFTTNNGSASITNLVIVSTTQATFTLNPGDNIGSLIISDNNDSATCTVSVGNSVTFSGSNLTSWVTSGGNTYVFDPVTEFTQDAVGHVIVVSGGTGFTAGSYYISSINMQSYLGTQGTHNVINLSGGVGVAAVNVSDNDNGVNGAWSYFMGSGNSNTPGYSGNNLIPWTPSAGGNNWFFDPDSEISPSINGATVTVSGGTGFTPGTYAVNMVTGLNYGTSDAGPQSMMSLSPATLTSGSAYGASWVKAGGAVIPTPTVNTSFTGAIKVGLIGDSITGQQGSLTHDDLVTQYPNAASIVVSNQGVSGSTATTWLIGDASGNLTNAITALNAIGATVVSIMLGSNDANGSIPAATHKTNMQSIVNSLFSGITTLRYVVLEEQPYTSNNSGADTLLQQYYASYATVSGAVQGITGSLSNYQFFQANPQLLQDGLHPTPAGNGEIQYTWLTSMASSIVAAGTEDSSSSDSSISSASSDSSSHSSQSSASSASSDSSSHSSGSSASSASSNSSSHSDESSHSSGSSSSSRSSFALYVTPERVLTGEEYLSIAQQYAQARVNQLSAVNDFYEPVDIIAKLNQIQPTLDLLRPFYQTYLQASAKLGSTGAFETPVRKLQSHVLAYGGESTVAGYIEKYIVGNGLAAGIPEEWAVLSKTVGVNIDSVIDPATIVASSSTTSGL